LISRRQKHSEFLANVAQRGDAEAVRDLIAAGVIVSTEPVQPRLGMPGTALENAAQRGDVEMLRALLSAGFKDPDAKTRGSEARLLCRKRWMASACSSDPAPILPRLDVLIQASASGILTVVQEILKYKPDVNSRGRAAQTALIGLPPGISLQR